MLIDTTTVLRYCGRVQLYSSHAHAEGAPSRLCAERSGPVAFPERTGRQPSASRRTCLRSWCFRRAFHWGAELKLELKVLTTCESALALRATLSPKQTQNDVPRLFPAH